MLGFALPLRYRLPILRERPPDYIVLSPFFPGFVPTDGIPPNIVILVHLICAILSHSVAERILLTFLGKHEKSRLR